MTLGTIFLIIIGLAIGIPVLCCIVYNMYEKHNYNTKGANQKLMFNELAKGDYLWLVSNNGIERHTVDKITYFFRDNHSHIEKIRIYYNEWDYIEVYASEAKSFKHGNWHTIKQAAELEFKRRNNAINEGISKFKGATSEDIDKAQKKLLEQLNKIK